MKDTFRPVSTTPEIPPSSNLSRLQDDDSGLTIVLSAPDETRYQIQFPRRLAYLVTDEGDRLLSMDYLDGRAATPVGQIENSRFLKWFVEETLEIRTMDSLIHWCIVTSNDIIDVIDQEPPHVSILTQ